MDFYPAEVATPPLALVALLGCQSLHGIIGEFLRAAQKPPINSLGIGDPAMAARVFGEKKASMTAPSGPLNILKADWFPKHRQQRPAVAAVFFEREAVMGDPAQWARVLAGLEAVRQATRPRGARVVLVIVSQPGSPPGELPEERLAALTRQAALDRRWVISFGTGEGEVALRRLSRALFEAAAAFYSDDARRRLAIHAERRNPAPAVSVRTAFKVAALAEFRADWASAVKAYQSAYAELRRVEPTGPLPLQRWTELTAVAELIHLKVVTLLLHQQNVAEALGQFRAHMAAFRRPPLPPPPAAAAAHAAWLVRQYSVMGELLSQRVSAGLLPPQREAQPAHFLLGAAHAAVDRRRAAQRAWELRPTCAAAAAPAVVPGVYVGQFLAAEGLRRLTEEEYLHFLEVSKQGAGDDLAAAALAKLQSAHELLMASPGGRTRQTRMAYHLGALMAREHLVAQNPAAAGSMLLSVAGIYRREGWEVPLGAALLELRECAARLKLPEEHVRHSLELSALRRSLDRPQREDIARAAIATLCSPDPPQPSPGTPHSPTVKAGGVEAAKEGSVTGALVLPGGVEAVKEGSVTGALVLQGGVEAVKEGSVTGALVLQGGVEAVKERSVTGAALEFRMRPVKDGLLSALALSCGFQPVSDPNNATDDTAQKTSAAAADSAQPVRFGVALWSNIPADLPASSILVNVEEQGGRSLQVAAQSAPPRAAATAGGTEESSRGRTDPILIRPGQWTRAWATWQPASSRRARVTDVIVYLGPHAAFVWTLGLFSPGAVPIGQPGGSAEELRPAFPPDAVLAGVYDMDVPSSHAAPVLEVSSVEVGIAGEQLNTEVAISVRGSIFRPVLSLNIAHADTSGEAPELFLPSSGSSSGVAEAASSALTVPLDDCASGQLRQNVLIRLPCSGRVTLNARLNYQTAEAGGEDGQVVAMTSITVVDPFQLQLVCSAPARTCTLIVADPQTGEQGEAPLPTMLPTGQPCIAQASLASLMPCDVILRHISVEPPASSEPESPGVSILGFVPTATEEAPVVFRKGDVHTVVAQMLGQRAGRGLPSGYLTVTWQRSRPPDVQTVRSSDGASTQAAATAVAEVPPAVVTRIPLPAQDWGAPLLEAAVEWDPPTVVAGAQFELRLRLRNRTHHLVELGIRLGDTSGFVLAGTRAGSASVLPYQESVLRWQLIATASGSLPLPEVHLSAARWAASLQPLAGRRVFAQPPAPAAPALAANALATSLAQLST